MFTMSSTNRIIKSLHEYNIRIQKGGIISNQDPEEGTSTMVVIKWSEKMQGCGDNIYLPLCGGSYKEEDDYLVPWSGTDPYANMDFHLVQREQ